MEDSTTSAAFVLQPKPSTYFFEEETMYTQIFSEIKHFIRDEEGAAAVEYGLLAALIAVVVVVAVSTVGNRVCETFRTVATRLGGSPAACPAVAS
jgi:pilus assembly protein Flp/PilA